MARQNSHSHPQVVETIEGWTYVIGNVLKLDNLVTNLIVFSNKSRRKRARSNSKHADESLDKTIFNETREKTIKLP